MVNMKMLRKVKRTPKDGSGSKNLGRSETGESSLKTALGKFRRATGLVRSVLKNLDHGGVLIEEVEEIMGSSEKKPISSRKSMTRGLSGMELSVKPPKSGSRKRIDKRSSNTSFKKSFHGGAEDSIMVTDTEAKILLKKIGSMNSMKSGHSRGSRPGQGSSVKNRLSEGVISPWVKQSESSPRGGNLERSKTIISPIKKKDQVSFRGQTPPHLQIEILNPETKTIRTKARKASTGRSITTSLRNSMQFGQSPLGPLAMPKKILDMKDTGMSSPSNSGQTDRKIIDREFARQQRSKDRKRLSPHSTMSSTKIDQMNLQNIQVASGQSGQRSHNDTDGSETGRGGGRRLMDFGGPPGYYGDQNMMAMGGYPAMRTIPPQYFIVNNMQPHRDSPMQITTPSSKENGHGHRFQIPEQSPTSGNGTFDTPKQ